MEGREGGEGGRDVHMYMYIQCHILNFIQARQTKSTPSSYQSNRTNYTKDLQQQVQKYTHT